MSDTRAPAEHGSTSLDELHWLDATAQAELVHRNEIAPSEMIEHAIARIEKVGPTVGAVIHERFDRARSEAAAVDRSLPLAGIATLVKETSPMAGEPHDLGNAALARAGRRAVVDDPAVALMRRSGMIVVGQSMAPEFALMSTSENAAHGQARNPWDLSLTSGGSSGGASSATAAGLVPLGQGGDGGGSIRMPASFCDLVGLKPTLGLIRRKPGGDRWGHSVPGFVTRSVRDTALIMDLLRSAEPGEVGRGMSPTAFRDALTAPPSRLRVGALTNRTTSGEPVDAEVDAQIEVAAGLIASLGHDVVEEHPSAFLAPENITAFFDALSVTATQSIDAIANGPIPLDRADLDPVTRLWDDRGRTITGVELAAAFTRLEVLCSEMADWWRSGFDVLVAPVFATAPKSLGWPYAEPDGIRKTVDVVRLTAPINSTGQPAIAVPIGFSDRGAPIGVQLIGAHGSDETLIALAAQIEAELRFDLRRPPSVA